MPLNDLFAQWGHHGWGIGSRTMGWVYGMGWLGAIPTAAFWIANILGIVFLRRRLVVSSGAGYRRADSEDSTMEILKRRYALGEVKKQEFVQKRKALGD